MTDDTVVHEHPVWRERANFIVAARIDPPPDYARWRWEQLWARQVAGNRFRLCCIPFFIYNMALDDEVETGEGTHYEITRVINPSGRYTFRAWFHNSDVRREVADELERLGCLLEWRSVRGNLLAIDAASDIQAQATADFLWQREQLGHLTYETGRTEVD
jgi:hypothetical protein